MDNFTETLHKYISMKKRKDGYFEVRCKLGLWLVRSKYSKAVTEAAVNLFKYYYLKGEYKDLDTSQERKQ